jgi:hypothetical protein
MYVVLCLLLCNIEATAIIMMLPQLVDGMYNAMIVMACITVAVGISIVVDDCRPDRLMLPC